jgi:tetratricopeptide (TPR) repeat protein
MTVLLLDLSSTDMSNLYSSSSPAELPRNRIRRSLDQLKTADRLDACLSLASALRQRIVHHADDNLTDQIINLEREALDLCPEGHPDRSTSCVNLANILSTRYERTGDVGLLDEAIDLEREALGLRPEGHPDRSTSCVNLANILSTRYERTGDVGLLDEAINLEREALDLRPEGHPDRSRSCVNLVGSLKTRYERTGDVGLLVEAIDLEREALGLRPEGHPGRSTSCGNLAISLSTHYERTGDVGLLDEAINLQREALGLRPEGHPDRSMSCGNLAVSLRTRFQLEGDADFLHQMFALRSEALTIAHKHAAWRHSTGLAWIHLQVTGPFYSVTAAITHLSQALKSEHDNIRKVVGALSHLLDEVWNHDAEGKHIELITIYQRLVSHLPLLAHPALGVQIQLQAMKGCARLGSDAFVNAALAGDCSSGFESLELAQSMIWSQSLHRRNPQLKDVPESLADRLQELLHAMVMSSVVESHYGKAAARIQRDTLHVNSSRLDALVREIRALPGLDRFMRGENFETLRTAADDQPVVVLVGARGSNYALIIASSLIQGYTLLVLDINDEDVDNTSFQTGAIRSCRGGEALGDLQSTVERLSLGKHTPKRSERLNRSLKALWLKVVKPVIDHLGLQVRDRNNSRFGSVLIGAIVITPPSPTPLALVSYRQIQHITTTCGWHLRWIKPS